MASKDAMKRFVATFDEKAVTIQVTKMNKTYQIWLGTPDSGTLSLSNMTVSMNTRFDSLPLTTQLLSSGVEVQDSWGESLSQKLAKKLNSQVFVHCSLPASYDGIIFKLEQELMTRLPDLII
jgi:hypothetical protein